MSVNLNLAIKSKKFTKYIKELDYYGYTKIENLLSKKQTSHF